MNISGTNIGALAGQAPAATSPLNTAPAPASTEASKTVAYEPRDLGLSVLQAEIRQVLSSRLKLSFGGNGYDSTKISVAGVASESLSAASWLLRQAPLEAADELRDLRDDIEDAGEVTRAVVAEEDFPDVDKALTRIDNGLESLGKEADRNTVSSASVLAAESMVKQRSSVRIRTQDSDVVTLSFRQRESLSAVSVADASGSIDRLEMNSQSRMDLKVRGDLDDGEMQAIKAVFERAQEIAGSFFGGDLAAAFSKASELEFDRSELAKVKMKFREQEVSRIQFTQVGTYAAPQPQAPTPTIESPDVAAPAVLTKAPDVAAPAVPTIAPDVSPNAMPADDSATAVAAAESEPVTTGDKQIEPSTEQTSAIERFVVDIRSFLRATMEGFEKSDGQRYFYSESFKLSLLRSVIETSAPEQSAEASDRAVAVVNAIDESD